MRREIRCLLLGLMATAACQANQPDQASSGSPEDLKRADSLFAVATASDGPEGWAGFFAEDGVMYPSSGRVVGRQAILEAMSDALGPGLPSLEWIPQEAELAQSGDLGFTTGRWRSVAPDGGEILASGHYLTVWRLTAEGWRVVADIGNSDSVPRDF